MRNKFNFLLILLRSNPKKHLGIFILSSVLIWLLASVLFISSSIQKDIFATLDAQADITLQRYKDGLRLDTPQSWLDEALAIQGVEKAQGRIYGIHYYEPKEEHFTIVGIDFYDEQIEQELQTLLKSIDIEKFLSRKNMIIGSGVKEFFDTYAYTNSYTFRPPDRSKEKVYIYDTLPKETNLIGSDVILMDSDEARKILGIPEGYVSDIILKVPNKKERQMVYEKLLISHFDSRIITKEDIAKHYKNLFNYKGGVFLILYLIALSTFLLILYQRYSMIKTEDAKEVAILRSLGWQIKEIIWFKLLENFIIVFFAYLTGVTAALIYVYYLSAPLLKYIFVGYQNLNNKASFSPSISTNDLSLLFILFVTPFLLAIVIPVWKLAITEANEVMK
ncbi:FtsX-like permease family protein [Sulfurimonas sp.]|uniref:ABC transporter permease n=1 Tax=Sulfurimonas sp. TaxID=2022749 RepID=UPI002607A286|nr:FtsX-like permease family protein [Sulfurimonas sp.]